MSKQTDNRPVGVGLIGCGTIGYGVVKLLEREADLYARRLGRPLRLVRIVDKRTSFDDPDGVVPHDRLTQDIDDFFNTPDMDIVIELAGGRGIVSQFVQRALKAGKHVVTANKALLAAEGPELFRLARQHHVSIGFEASCGGGIPCILALTMGLMSNRIRGLYGILNGTCNYILTEMTREGKDYATALKEAQQAGYAEADPTLDVTGGDTAHKVAILASLAFGIAATDEQVSRRGIDTLDLLDIRFGAEMGYDIKLLGIAEQPDGPGTPVSLAVEPCFIHAEEPLAQVRGSFNALSVYGHAVGHTMFYGRGAGQDPTASAVVADVMNIADGWYAHAFAQRHTWPDQQQPAKLIDPDQQVSRFYLRINMMDRPATLAKVTAILGDAGISISGVVQHEQAVDKFVPVIITTHDAQAGALRGALAKIEALDVIDGKPVAIRIIEMPRG